jgi:hypothetical protein
MRQLDPMRNGIFLTQRKNVVSRTPKQHAEMVLFFARRIFDVHDKPPNLDARWSSLSVD